MTLALEDGPDGVVLRVRAAPGASRERIVGVLGDALKVAVSAPPEKGRANRRIVEVLAKELGLRPRNLSLLSGATSADKRFVVTGISAAELGGRIDARLSP